MNTWSVQDWCVWCGAEEPAPWVVVYGCPAEHVFVYSFCDLHKNSAINDQVDCPLCWLVPGEQQRIMEVMCRDRNSDSYMFVQWDDKGKAVHGHGVL